MDTIRIKHSDDEGNDHMVINKADFDPSKHEPFDEESAKAVEQKNDRGQHPMVEADDAMRQHNANRGVTTGQTRLASERNPSGTFSEPTPTDIRYPNKDATEFENNHGAFIGKSAAQMRAAQGLPDEPGGVKQEEAAAVKAKADAALAPVESYMDKAGLRVAKGPGGKFFVYDGRERVSPAMDSEDEANAALDAEKAKRSEQTASADQAASSTAASIS